MAWFESHLGTNGSSVSTILTAGQISTTSNYATAYFNDISDFTHIFLKMYYDISGEIDAYFDIPLELIPDNGYYDFTVYVPNPVNYLSCRITRTSIALTHYSGEWRNIYCNVKGISDAIWG